MPVCSTFGDVLVPLNLVWLISVTVAALRAPEVIASEEFRFALRPVAMNGLSSRALLASHNEIPREWFADR